MTNTQPRRRWPSRLGDLCTRHKAATALVVLGGVVGIGAASSVLQSPDTVAASARATATTVARPAPTTTEHVPTTVAPTTAAAPTVAPPTAAPTTAAAPATAPPTTTAAAMTVTNVVDGDTLDVSSGARIRLIGIDTPEIGQCGADVASERLAALTLGQAVTLVPGARDDVDRYGRLLRYVDVSGVDAGKTLLAEALAVPRYNSGDGYGAHTREAEYQAAWNSVAWAASPCRTPATTPAPPSSGGDAVYYANCTAARAAGAAPIYAGQPGYRAKLDRNHDGVACE